MYDECMHVEAKQNIEDKENNIELVSQKQQFKAKWIAHCSYEWKSFFYRNKSGWIWPMDFYGQSPDYGQTMFAKHDPF